MPRNSLKRFVVPPKQIRGSTITLDDPQELHHLRAVLRLKPGDRLICFDGQGSEYLGTIDRQTSQQVVIRIENQLRLSTEQDPLTLWLVQALPKSARFDWVVQKATELGVSRISPLITQRTIVRPSSAGAEAKRTRWQRIAQAAAKQCRRATIPTVDAPRRFEEVVTAFSSDSLVLIPTLESSTIPIGQVLKAASRVTEVVILIGPEGDFTADEVALAKAHGAQPVSLGPLTLRAETAALASLAVVRYALAPR